jgi:2,4-dienoyl-CoA reductase-like NADH-dependent reductase (Old Yellow Enzyme family)
MRLCNGIHAADSLAFVQLHHAGRRSPKEIIGEDPVCPAADEKAGARAMTTAEVEEMIEAFIVAAVRSEKAGYDGVELHGAHDYVICQFLNAELNTRSDQYGGSFENRSRVLFDIVDGVRERCGADFNLAVRLSPERFGMKTSEIVEVFGRLVDGGKVDLIDMSLWDCFKEAADEDFAGQRLIDIFANLERGDTRLAVAGKLYSAADTQRAVDAGADIVAIGRAAVTNHDFPILAKDPSFAMRELPVPREVLLSEGLSESFVSYMGNWPGFVGE